MEIWMFLWGIFCGTKQWTNFKIKKHMGRIHMAMGNVTLTMCCIEILGSTISVLNRGQQVTSDMWLVTGDRWHITCGPLWAKKIDTQQDTNIIYKNHHFRCFTLNMTTWPPDLLHCAPPPNKKSSWKVHFCLGSVILSPRGWVPLRAALNLEGVPLQLATEVSYCKPEG